MANKTFLITGALGCIGAWTVRNLLQANVPTVVFDLGTDRRRLRLISSDEDLAKVTFVQGDVTDLAQVEQVVIEHSITHIIHLAGLQVPFCRANPTLGAQVNVVGTVNLFEAARRHALQVQRLVYASSIAIFDIDDVRLGESISDNAAGHPSTLYGVYKQANEGTARVYWKENKVSSIGLRPYIVYGPGRDQGMTSSPTKAMFAAAMGQPYHIPYGGRADYEYADDVARHDRLRPASPGNLHLPGDVGIFAPFNRMLRLIRDTISIWPAKSRPLICSGARGDNESDSEHCGDTTRTFHDVALFRTINDGSGIDERVNVMSSQQTETRIFFP